MRGYDDGFFKGLMKWFGLMGSEKSVSMGMRNRYEYGRRMWACKVGNGFNGCEKMKKNEYGYEFGRYEGRIGTRVAMDDRIGCIFPVFLFQIFAAFL